MNYIFLNGYIIMALDLDCQAPALRAHGIAAFLSQLRASDAGEGDQEGPGWGSPILDIPTVQAVLALHAMGNQVLAALLPVLSDGNAAVRMEAMNAATLALSRSDAEWANPVAPSKDEHGHSRAGEPGVDAGARELSGL